MNLSTMTTTTLLLTSAMRQPTTITLNGANAVTDVCQALEAASTDARVHAVRLDIATKDAKPLLPNRLTFFSLPGELRNEIYRLTLEKDYQRVPVDPCYLNRPDPYVALLQTCSAVYFEARSYMVEKQTAYIPVMPGMDWRYGEPEEEYGYSRATKDTTVCALTDFMSVHFHLHLELLRKEDYNPDALIGSLAQAIKVCTPHSWDLYLKHGLGKRRAIVHLDHLLSLWPKLFGGHNCVRVGTFQHLIQLMAKDKMTDWEIRYYVSTGQNDGRSTYGNCHSPDAIRDTELAQLRYYALEHSNITLKAEIFGEDMSWTYGDKVQCVTRHRTPITEFWPNLHFDPSRYDIITYDKFKQNYPENMPIEEFDDEVLEAGQKDRERRQTWMMALNMRDEAKSLGVPLPPQYAELLLK